MGMDSNDDKSTAMKSAALPIYASTRNNKVFTTTEARLAHLQRTRHIPEAHGNSSIQSSHSQRLRERMDYTLSYPTQINLYLPRRQSSRILGYAFSQHSSQFHFLRRLATAL
jgi:hypothetical protein